MRRHQCGSLPGADGAQLPRHGLHHQAGAAPHDAAACWEHCDCQQHRWHRRGSAGSRIRCHETRTSGEVCLGFPLFSHKGCNRAPCCPQGFFNSLRSELSDYPNIHISTVCPGPVISKIVHNAFTEEVNKVISVCVCVFVKLVSVNLK